MKKKGVALVLAICAVFVLLFVGIILVLLAKRETGLTVSLKHRQEAFNYAEAGLGKAYNTLYRFGIHSTTLNNYPIHFEKGWFTREGYDTTIQYLRHRPLPGFQTGPRFMAGGRFEAFYYHVSSSGFKGNTRRTLHVTVERVFPIEQ